jgi:hypothetical protein
MRTTLNIDDDVLEIAKSMAHIHQMSVGEAVSHLARRGMRATAASRRDPVTGLLVFDPDEARQFGPAEIRRAEASEDLEYAKYFRKP